MKNSGKKRLGETCGGGGEKFGKVGYWRSG